MKQVINVIQEDIDKAIKEYKINPTSFVTICPIAQAFLRITGMYVRVGSSTLNSYGMTCILPEHIKGLGWLTSHTWNILKPFSFEIEIPK